MTSTKVWMLGDSLFQIRLQKWLRCRTSFSSSTPEKGGVVRRLPCKVSGSRKDKKRGASFFASNLETGNRKSFSSLLRCCRQAPISRLSTIDLETIRVIKFRQCSKKRSQFAKDVRNELCPWKSDSLY